VGTVITGVVVVLTTTLSSATGGPDTPAIAVLSVLASSIAASLSNVGLSVHVVIINALVAITVATVFSGLFLFSLGALRLGKWLRFVPYPVVAGFLAGSGVLMIAGGLLRQTSVYRQTAELTFTRPLMFLNSLLPCSSRFSSESCARRKSEASASAGPKHAWECGEPSREAVEKAVHF
jgi:MFS superfamily sulfate permease-like transporter